MPKRYADAFARLQQEKPRGVDLARWRQAMQDGGLFLDRWGVTADALGWEVADVFGLDPVAPLARYDAMGLIWLLAGATVRLLDERSATLSTGLVFRRKQHGRR
ncbi:hypothetical protein [Alsobacter soli]|uniref:hypothetical protein n=1 Tax=Alsobacter soli TaxID=2109933 RepID=UPI0011B267EB|nr:hypothetical protein [Alsobacter soli]